MQSTIRQEDYFCTWDLQAKTNRKSAEVKRTAKLAFAGDQGGGARDMLCEETVFGPNGWISYYPEIRSDLYFLIDDGWDVEYGIMPGDAPDKFGSHVLNEERFPSFQGTPCERLRQFADRVKEAGWKGLGIWLPAQAFGEDFEKPVKETLPYWRAMLERSKYAGVAYWKVDWGRRAYTPEDRRLISELAREVYPELVVEHAICCWLISEKDADYGRFARDEAYKRGVAFAEFSDVLRTYDVSAQLSVSTTLDRVAGVLPTASALLNCENEAYMGAALGMAVGIMSAPDTLGGQHMVAAVRWHRVAPAFSGGSARFSDEVLDEYYDFAPGSTWASFLFNRRVHQAAPAVIARNTELPQVTSEGECPFVVASHNPKGAYSVAVLPRRLGETICSSAAVTCTVDGAPSDIGAFGEFSTLTLRLQATPSRVVMQDLITEETWDISKDLMLRDTLCIPGEILSRAKGGAAHLMLTYE